MKTLIALIVLASSTFSLAGETTILTETLSNRVSQISLYRTQYRINTELGRAWMKVEVQYDHRGGHAEEWSYIDKRVKVPGMSYDNRTGNIVFNGVVCATTKSGRRSIKIYPTGSCKANLHVNTIRVDDGFNIVTKKKVDVTLSTY